jgi:hypothetical protein
LDNSGQLQLIVCARRGQGKIVPFVQCRVRRVCRDALRQLYNAVEQMDFTSSGVSGAVKFGGVCKIVQFGPFRDQRVCRDAQRELYNAIERTDFTSNGVSGAVEFARGISHDPFQ